MTTYEVDWEEVGTFIAVILVIAAIFLIPVGICTLIWFLLSPVGFWQVFAAVILLGGIATAIVIAELLVLLVLID